jgi:hypothetical protein
VENEFVKIKFFSRFTHYVSLITVTSLAFRFKLVKKKRRGIFPYSYMTTTAFQIYVILIQRPTRPFAMVEPLLLIWRMTLFAVIFERMTRDARFMNLQWAFNIFLRFLLPMTKAAISLPMAIKAIYLK